MTQSEAILIEQENRRCLNIEFKKGFKVSEDTIARRNATIKRNKMRPDDSKIYQALDKLIVEIERSSKFFNTISNYKKGFLFVLEQLKAGILNNNRNIRSWLGQIFVEEEGKLKGFKKRIEEIFKPGYADENIQAQIESYFSFEDKTGKRRAKTKAGTVGKEFSRLVNSCRNDSYMFCNHKINPNEPSSIVYNVIGFDFDYKYNPLDLITTGLINMVVMDKRELEKEETEHGTIKKVKPNGDLKNLSNKTKFQAYIILESPVWGNNSKQMTKYKVIKLRLEYFFKNLGFEADTHFNNQVSKNVFNTTLYQSFLISSKTWTLDEIESELDNFGVPSYQEIIKSPVAKINYHRNFYTILDPDSRNCQLYNAGIHSDTETESELWDFLVNKNNNFNNLLSFSEVRRIHKSIVTNSKTWRRICVPGEQNAAQFIGTTNQMFKSLPTMKILKRLINGWEGSDSELARIAKEHIFFKTGKLYSLSHIRKCIQKIRNGWFEKLKNKLKIKSMCTFSYLKDLLKRFRTGIIEKPIKVIQTYIAYKINNFSRFYTEEELELLKLLI